MNRTQQENLLRLAREVLENRLLGLSKNLEKYNLPEFKAKRGIFVTLSKKKKLRGCIGRIEAKDSIYNNVIYLAQAAAFDDPRFEALEASELKQVKIEISILSEPKKVKGRTNFEKMARIRPQVDGVILSAGGRESTFLPQVWESVKTIDEFIGELCRKAGLDKDYWEYHEVGLSVYQVDHFSE
ncbi:MAG: AmmeMemoRadiSam system protein A [Deltaproteobacteria bacterium]|nr:AmmeMemoRadiSam system protein A [Deltaproteobacteria bacterium]